MTTPEDPYAGQPAPEHGVTPEQSPAATPPQQPVYYGQPPAPYYYGPPVPNPPNPPSRGAWFAIGAASMFALCAFAAMVLFVITAGAPSDPEGDFDDSEEYAYYVDQNSVVNAVEGPCANMRSAARDIDLFADPKAGASDIKGFTLAVKGIVDAIDDSDPNSDSKLWRDDWKTLGAALDTYAADLIKDGSKAKFSSITEDEPTIARMSYSSEADCEVPQIIEGMDPDLSLYWD